MSKILLITINESLRIGGVLPTAIYGDPYLATLKGYGGIDPYTWILSGSLPTGISADVDSNGFFVFSGTSTDVGHFPISVTLMDSEGRSVVQDFDLFVTSLPLTISGHLPDGTVGGSASYAYTISGGFGTKTVTVVSGAMPAGTSVSSVGVVSGTYTTGASNSWRLRVEDSLGAQAFLDDSNTVAWVTLSSTGALSASTVGNPVSGSITLSGGNGSYTRDASPVSGTRPAGNGLALVGSVYSDSSGVLTTAASYSWTDRFHSGDGQVIDVPFSIVVSDPARLHWRIYVIAINTAGNYCETTEIQMRSSPGGADQCNGGIATASSLFSGLPPAEAFDNSTSTGWSSSGSSPMPQWIAYQFTAPVNIVEVTVQAARTAVITRSFKTMKIQKSADGVTWEDVWQPADQTAWTASQVRTLTKP